MSKRKLRRQLSLVQVVMLGTAGTIAAEIFVLTGHAAGLAGPAAVLALLIGGLLSYAVALNYCELATAYPVAGGAMSYVREAYGTGLLSYLVGSMDCLSGTFYAALSAVGFAYSLQLFIPGLPIVPAAVAVVLVPLLALGLPTSATAAILLAAFEQYNLQPGPLLFAGNSTLVWGLIASMYLGNLVGLIVVLSTVPLFASILRIPVHMHNVPAEEVVRPSAWANLGTADPESADFRACATFGPLYGRR